MNEIRDPSILTTGTGSQLHPFSTLSEMSDVQFMVRSAEGINVLGADGRKLIDGSAGLWCVNVGYSRPEIVDAVTKQMNLLPFFHSFNGFSNEPATELTARIMTRAPEGIQRIFFGNSGSDANDTAVKMIWLYNNLRGKPEKKKIVSRWRGYHGVTVAAGSLTGLPSVHKFFDLPLPMVRHVSAPDSYRHPDRDAVFYAEELEQLILREGRNTVAAFIAEPVMGTGGVLLPPEGYFQAIREVCDRYDVLLVLDEIICGFGRLGSWFGADHFNVRPDMMTTAKGLTSSYLPMSAVLVGEKVWSTMQESLGESNTFAHGFTTSAHPVCAAAAIANLDIIEKEGLVHRAGEMGNLLLKTMQEKCANHPLVGDVRGQGLLVAVEAVADRKNKTGFDAALGVSARVRRAAIREGLLVRALSSDVLAFSPAFIVSPEEIHTIANRFINALDLVASDLEAERVWKPI
jgi:L-2,4-diaminobutyrate transaminase